MSKAKSKVLCWVDYPPRLSPATGRGDDMHIVSELRDEKGHVAAAIYTGDTWEYGYFRVVRFDPGWGKNVDLMCSLADAKSAALAMTKLVGVVT